MTKHIDDWIVSRRRSNALVQILRSGRLVTLSTHANFRFNFEFRLSCDHEPARDVVLTSFVEQR